MSPQEEQELMKLIQEYGSDRYNSGWDESVNAPHPEVHAVKYYRDEWGEYNETGGDSEYHLKAIRAKIRQLPPHY